MTTSTVIICTHNRAELLRCALDGLARMQVPEGGCEVIVIDNASKDDTPAVAKAGLARLPVPGRYVLETTLGLSNARNRAVVEATGEVLAFLDDDAIPEPDWLVALLAVYADHPKAECVGGQIQLDWRDPIPDWWHAGMDHHLSAIDYGDRVRQLTYPHYPFGANLSFKSTVFARGRQFNPELGRRGVVLAGGEEVDLCLLVEQDGGEVYYAPNSLVWHRADISRANVDYLYDKSVLHGRSCAQMEYDHFGFDFRIRKAVSFALHGLWAWARGDRTIEQGCDRRFWLAYVRESLRRAFV